MKPYKYSNKGCSSTYRCKRSIQLHLKECYNYTKRAEAVARNNVCDYCGMTFRKTFNSDSRVQNVHRSNIADSILSICAKSSALDFENYDKDSLEVSF